MAQRLSRRLCEESRRPVKIEGRLRELIDGEIRAMPESSRREAEALKQDSVYEGDVTPSCPKGTRGRIGIFEALEMGPELEKILLAGPSEAAISSEARRQGMLTMRQDGILKVLRGIIGMQELLEVV